MGDQELERTWTHTVCETCWFQTHPDRWPTQLIREPDDRTIDSCCLCGHDKLTRIFVRRDPASPALKCKGLH